MPVTLGSGHGRHGGESVNALHQLPAAFGGILEEVRWVLGETVDQFVAAGERIDHHVSREIDRGDASLAMNRFREAYQHYQRAYAGLTRGNHDDDSD